MIRNEFPLIQFQIFKDYTFRSRLTRIKIMGVSIINFDFVLWTLLKQLLNSFRKLCKRNEEIEYEKGYKELKEY